MKYTIKRTDLNAIVNHAHRAFTDSVKLPTDSKEQQAYLFLKGIEQFLSSKIEMNFEVENLDKERGESGDNGE